MAGKLAETAGVESVLPRICSRMTNRGNVFAGTVEDYYRLNVYLPLLDHLRSELQSQFTSKYCHVARFHTPELLGSTCGGLLLNLL